MMDAGRVGQKPLRVVRLAGVLLVIAPLDACMNDFDKFETTSNAASPDASAPVDAGRDDDASAPNDASADTGGTCRSTLDACVAERRTCRDGCDNARQTCASDCKGSFPCLQQCGQTEQRCRRDCVDACRTCAGACPSNECR